MCSIQDNAADDDEDNAERVSPTRCFPASRLACHAAGAVEITSTFQTRGELNVMMHPWCATRTVLLHGWHLPSDI
jgi:hypothetical protein